MIYYRPSEDFKSNKFIPFKIAYLYPDFSLENPSNRLRRFQIGNFLSKIPGVTVENFFLYTEIPNIIDKIKDFDIIVLFNLASTDITLCDTLKDKIIIFDHCERIFGFPYQDEIMKRVTAISCCSVALANITDQYMIRLNPHPQVFVIRDPIEDSILKNEQPIGQDNLALLMGMGGNIKYTLPFIAPIAEQAGYRIRIISEKDCSHLGHDFKEWGQHTWIKDALECSVALCFHNAESYPAKGNVKVTMPMALGLPVIASPVESYREIIEVDYNGYIAFTEQDWVTHLETLKNVPFRNLMGLRAKISAQREYSSQKIGMDYLSMIQKLQEMKRLKRLGL